MRMLLVDDHAVVREGFAALLAAEPDIEIVGQAAAGADALERFWHVKPDVVLLDLLLGDDDGFAFLRALGSAIQATTVVILSSHGGDANVLRALDAGAKGYVLKTAGIAEVLRIVRAAAAGHIALSAQLDIGGFHHGAHLTGCERRVLEYIAQGDTNEQIAARLNLALATVKTHAHHLMQKLQAHSRTDAVTKARRMGILLR